MAMRKGVASLPSSAEDKLGKRGGFRLPGGGDGVKPDGSSGS